jgi:hypothetical protein
VKTLSFINENGQKVDFVAKKLLNGGFAGRNQKAVWAHIKELEKIGVAPPKKTPTYYPLPLDMLIFDNEIEVLDTGNSAEIEYVLLFAKEEIYVALGCDHTDRDLETVSIPKSKLVYPNLISRQIWRYRDLIDYWDQIEIRCWLGEGKETLYQDATLEAIMNPEQFMEQLKELVDGDLEGLVFFSGTVAALTEGIAYSNFISGEMVDPVKGNKLEISYSVNPITWFKGEI